MTTDLHVDGSPSSCRATASDLRHLRRRADTASTQLGYSLVTAATSWGGESGAKFADRCRQLLRRADDLDQVLTSVPTGLETFADGLAEVKAEMRRAEGVARRAGIPVHGEKLPGYDDLDFDALPPGAEGAHAHAEAIALRARSRESTLQADLRSVLNDANGLAPLAGVPAKQAGGSDGPLGDALDGLGDLLGDGWEKATELVPPPDEWDLPPLTPSLLASLGKRGLHALDPRTPFRETVAAVVEQLYDDRGRDDLTPYERMLRATLQGSWTGAGGLGGALLCARLGAGALVTGCASVGSKLGHWGASRYLESLDD